MVKTLAIILVGVFLQLSAVWFLGMPRDNGLFFCCRGVPDDIYHLALTNELVSHFPPQEPGMTGVIVKNYHYLASLVMAELIRVFHLPLIPTVYQYFPLLVSLLLGLTVVALAQQLQLSQKVTRWWLFFLYFHGDILYLLTFLRGKGLNFDITIFDDATKFLAGPPRSFSITLLFTGLVLFLIWRQQKKLLPGILAAVVLGSLIGFKVYTGIFALIGMATVGTYYLYKRDWKMTIPPILTLLISLGFYLPVNGASGGLSWNGFYRFDNFVSQPAFGLQNLELLRLTGANYLLIPFGGLYLVFLFGTVILGIFSLGKLPKDLNLFLLPATLATAVIGLFFVQNIGGLNTVQFLIGLYFILSLYAALTVSRFPFVLALMVIALTLPRPLYEAWGNFQMAASRRGLFISQGELAGLNYLKNNTAENAVVALPPDFARQEISLQVGFLTNRPLYLAGYGGVLQDHQVPGAEKRLENPDFSKIDYLYLPKKYSVPFDGKEVFANPDVVILKHMSLK